MEPSDLAVEGLRLVESSQTRGGALRVMGGIAVELCSPSARVPPLARRRPDLDFVAYRAHAHIIRRAFAECGWDEDAGFNRLHGHKRLLFLNRRLETRADVFLDRLDMCHELGFAGRLELCSPTLPVADLILTKLQAVEFEEKDAKDVCALLIDHHLSVDAVNGGAIQVSRVVAVLANDWGWYRTVSGNLRKLPQWLEAIALPEEQRQPVLKKGEALLQAVEQAPKSLRWKTRAAIGERVPWYNLPSAPEPARPLR